MTSKTIVAGKCTGLVLKTTQPINFLGMIDSTSGKISDSKHELYNQNIKNTILVFPHGIGSSVGAYTVYGLKINDVAPAAMICTRADASVVSGCAIAGIPLLIIEQGTFDTITSGQNVSVDSTVGTILPV